ncbi:MAG: hypothetical protein U0R80_07385 [Nocardioidaceae bacterium]
MHERPELLSDAEVLALVTDEWVPAADAVDYLPVGFGAFHWRALAAGEPVAFVTYDEVSPPRRTRGDVEDAYAAGAELARAGLEFLHAPLPRAGGGLTVPVAEGLLSATPWLAGDPPRRPGLEARLLPRLHAAAPPPTLPPWRPLVDADLPDVLTEQVAQRWDGGPLGEQARRALLARLGAVAAWTADYLGLAASSDPAGWVPTHGEPGAHNQLVDAAGRVHLVDLESLRLAPRERDLAGLLPLDVAWRSDYGGPEPAPSLLRMFDLEWRLDEVSQYAVRFAAAHTGDADDRTALGGLLHELDRPDRRHYVG